MLILAYTLMLILVFVSYSPVLVCVAACWRIKMNVNFGIYWVLLIYYTVRQKNCTILFLQ